MSNERVVFKSKRERVVVHHCKGRVSFGVRRDALDKRLLWIDAGTLSVSVWCGRSCEAPMTDAMY